MKLFLYYALHSVKNQFKKLFKTWVVLFLAACVIIGGLIGLGASKLEELSGEGEESGIVEVIPGEEDWCEDIPDPDIELPDDAAEPDIRIVQLVELIAGAAVLAVFVFEIVGADKNGSRIFLPADVNLLFAAPMRPQSVLLFRLMTQLGMAILASIYLLFQLPNLMLNLGLGLWAALAVIATWCLTIAVGKLLQTLLYTVCSTHPAAKPYLRRGVYVLLALLAAAYFLFWKRSGETPLSAAMLFFNAPVTRYIPAWGWLKGITAFALEGSAGGALACMAASALTVAALLLVARQVKADFYEDAMAKSEEMAELLERAQSEKSSGIVFAKRKKDRSDRLRRDGMNHGAGASVFFHKSLYNRFRFAHLGIFTKTAETYLAAAAGMALLCKLVFNTGSFIPVALILAVFVFYRTLGNPLEQDTKMDYFRLVPESMWAKLFYSLLGGTVNCLLDLLPGMIAAVVILRADPLAALGWLVLIVSVDFYATNVGTFIGLSVPVSAGKTVKQIVQVMFLYFGLLPDIAIMAVALVMEQTAAGIIICAVVNVLLGLVFFMLSPLFLTPGAGRRNPEAAALDASDARRAKKTFSRLGLSGFMILLTAAVLQGVAVGVLDLALPAWRDWPWSMWALAFAPLYLVAVPVGILIARGAPAVPLEKGKMGVGRYVGVVFISIFLLEAGNLVGILLQSLLEKLVGAMPVNPIESFAMDESLLLRILFMVILAPLIEEFIFRKTFIDRMHPYGEKLAVVTSAVMFGLFHGNLSQMFYAFTLGLVLGYVYLRTGKLRYSVSLHALINLFGGVVSVELAERAVPDMAVLEQLGDVDPALLEQLESGNIAQVMQALEGAELPDPSALITPGMIAFGAYTVALLASAVVGLVVLCIRSRKVYFRPAPLELPRAQRCKTVYLNVGMILFVLLCLVSVVGTYLG